MSCNLCNDVGFHVQPGHTATARVCECKRECKTCKGHRFVVKREGLYEVAQTCECVATLNRATMFNRAQIPGHYANKNLGNRSFKRQRHPSIDAAAQAIGRFIPKDNVKRVTRGLVLMGGYGLGKTHLVCGLAARLTLGHGIPVRFVDYQGLLASIRATFGKPRDAGGETEHTIVAALTDASLLIIDDLGRGQGTPWELSIIDQVISRRYNAEAPLIVTTNYLMEPLASGAESLEGRIGERLVSRFKAACEVVHMTGEDYRAVQAMEAGAEA